MGIELATLVDVTFRLQRGHCQQLLAFQSSATLMPFVSIGDTGPPVYFSQTAMYCCLWQICMSQQAALLLATQDGPTWCFYNLSACISVVQMSGRCLFCRWPPLACCTTWASAVLLARDCTCTRTSMTPSWPSTSRHFKNGGSSSSKPSYAGF